MNCRTGKNDMRPAPFCTALAAALAVALAPAASFAQQVAISPNGQNRLVVSGWPADTFACTLYWNEPGADGETAARADTRRVPAGVSSYEITASGAPTGTALACTPDTPPGVTQTPEGCRELVRPAYGAMAQDGFAKQFRDQNPGQSIVFRIALTPDEDGAPQNVRVVPQNATEPNDIVEWGERISAQLEGVAAQSRFTAECAGARIMLPFTLR